MPLLEAMVFGVPVIAYDAGAVRETLAGGGVLAHGQAARRGGRCSCTRSRPTQRCGPPSSRPSRRALAALRAIDFGALLPDRLAPVLGAAAGPREGRPVGAGAAPRRRHRRLRAADARRLPPLGPHGRRLRARAGRGPRRATAGPGRDWRAGGPGRRRHPPLRAALAAVRRPARSTRAGACCCTTTSRPPTSSSATTPRWCTSARSAAPSWLALPGTSTWRSATASSTGASSRRRASRARACCRSTSTSTRYRERPNAGAAPPARRRAHQRAVRRTDRAQQAPGRPRPAGVVLEALHRPRRAPAARRQAAAAPPLLRRAAVALLRGAASRPGRCCCPGTSPTTTCSRTTPRRTCSCRPERPRGLRRAARGVDADGRADRRVPHAPRSATRWATRASSSRRSASTGWRRWPTRSRADGALRDGRAGRPARARARLRPEAVEADPARAPGVAVSARAARLRGPALRGAT